MSLRSDPKAQFKGYCSQDMAEVRPMNQSGQGLVEYVLILILVSIVVNRDPPDPGPGRQEHALQRFGGAFDMTRLVSFLRRGQSGQGMVEYAFILVLISLVVIVMLITTGGQIKNLFSDITYTLNNQAGL